VCGQAVVSTILGRYSFAVLVVRVTLGERTDRGQRSIAWSYDLRRCARLKLKMWSLFAPVVWKLRGYQ
jgi:hypothetical protein